MSFRVRRVTALTVLFFSLPTAAYAVSVSSNDGSGMQRRDTAWSNGASVYGDLQSTSGKAVYYAGRVAFGGCTDPSTGRYGANVTQTTPQYRQGIIQAYKPVGCSFQGVKSRICTVKDNLPDPCGTDSLTY
jgi:hypothetical protein